MKIETLGIQRKVAGFDLHPVRRGLPPDVLVRGVT
jgi:hypothetical protein